MIEQLAQAEADLAGTNEVVERLVVELKAARIAQQVAVEQVRAAQRRVDAERPQAAILSHGWRQDGPVRKPVCIVRRTAKSVWCKGHGERDSTAAQWRQDRTGVWRRYPVGTNNTAWLEIAE
jgi:hypothetical protein